MDPFSQELLKTGVGVAAKIVFSKVLDSKWLPRKDSGKKIVEQLLSTDIYSDYLVKHVSRVMKMRTIHSSEHDVFLNDIYHPLLIRSNACDYKVEDGFFIENNKVSNIIGVAGQGKSTILRKLFLETLTNGNKIPIFLELRKIERVGISNALIKMFSEINIDVDELSIKSLFENDKIVIMLDGFDEISSEKRGEILSQIVELNRAYGVQFITTTRPETEICNESDIVNYRVFKLKRSDVISILKKLSASQEVESDTLPQIFLVLKGNSSLTEILNSPLLVTLFYICYPHLDSIPDSAIEFYEKLFNTLYFRHDKVKNFVRERKSLIPTKDAFDCFCSFCFRSIYDNKLDFTYHSLIDYVSQAMKMKGIEDKNSDNLATDFVDITCLIQRDGFDRYVFLHKSIQEYHAAEYIKSLGATRKEQFYTAIKSEIEKDSRLSAVARYLYEIDKDNAINFMVIPLCKKWEVDDIDDNLEHLVEKLYNEVAEKTEVMVSNELISLNSKKINIKNSKRIIQGLGPFGDAMRELFIFSVTQTTSNPISSLIIDELIVEDTISAINDGSLERYERHINNNIIQIPVAAIFSHLNKTEKIKGEIGKIIVGIHNELYKKNMELLSREDEVIKSILGLH